jgi:CBS domain containing-hemolysin-like protein
MAGLLLERIGRIPSGGEKFTFEDCGMRVLRAEPNRILALEVRFGPAGAGRESRT